MRHAAPIIVALAVALVLGIWLAQHPGKRGMPEKATTPQPSEIVASGVTVRVSITPQPTRPTDSSRPLPGETILRDYAKLSLPPENDLALASRMMDNFLLLVKSAADRPLSANEDWAAALRGHNPVRERFLPDHHTALNTNGQLVDRWGTPLFFHSLGGRRHELRSAGPDRRMWTADDLHRNSDGSYRRGDQLNPESLLGGWRHTSAGSLK